MHLPHHDEHFEFANVCFSSLVCFGCGIISLNKPTTDAIKANKDISI